MTSVQLCVRFWFPNCKKYESVVTSLCCCVALVGFCRQKWIHVLFVKEVEEPGKWMTCSLESFHTGSCTNHYTFFSNKINTVHTCLFSSFYFFKFILSFKSSEDSRCGFFYSGVNSPKLFESDFLPFWPCITITTITIITWIPDFLTLLFIFIFSKFMLFSLIINSLLYLSVFFIIINIIFGWIFIVVGAKHRLYL